MKRAHNEDNFAVIDAEHVFAVCDGMGGHAAGEVAAQLAVDTLRAFYATGDEIDAAWPENRLVEAVRLAHRRIILAGLATPERSGMGTTIVAAAVNGDEIHIAHVGDSRAYRLRDNAIEPLTRDHSLLEEMKAFNPHMSAAEERAFPHKNVITRALGIRDVVRVDVRSERLRPGDRILLCSDGLSGMLDDAVLLDCIRGRDDPETTVNELIDRANRAGGFDNITAILIDYDPA